jgi:hypothetical protein
MDKELAVGLGRCDGRATDSELCDRGFTDLGLRDGWVADSELRNGRTELREERGTDVEEGLLKSEGRERFEDNVCT